MTNRKYRLICLLNALERRLRELHGRGATLSEILDAFYNEIPGIVAITAPADTRYLRGRLDYMLESHCDEVGMEDARRNVSYLLGQADVSAPQPVQRRVVGIGVAV